MNDLCSSFQMLIGKDTSRQVINMPSRLNNNYDAVRLQTGKGSRDKEIPHFLPIQLTLGFLTVLYGVINDQNICSTTRNRPAHTNTRIASTFRHLPLLFSLFVKLQSKTKDSTERLTINNVSCLRPKINRKITRI